MQARAAPATEALRAAFRDVHGRRLHGFALLLVLGDRARAARLAADAIAEGTARVDELRHPERAAAWLRSRVVRAARRPRPGVGRRAAERLRALRDLGMDEAVHAGLNALGHLERAALVAEQLERLDSRDVATVVGRHGPTLERLLARARRRYALAYAAAAPQALPDGPLAQRVADVAQRAIT